MLAFLRRAIAAAAEVAAAIAAATAIAAMGIGKESPVSASSEDLFLPEFALDSCSELGSSLGPGVGSGSGSGSGAT